MPVRFKKSKLMQSIILAVIFSLAFIASGCREDAPTPTAVASFSFQVRVQSSDTNKQVRNAKVTVEVVGKAPLEGYTDSTGLARIFVSSVHANQPGFLIIEASGYKTYRRNIDLVKGTLPSIVHIEPLTAITPISAATPSPSASPLTPTSTNTSSPQPATPTPTPTTAATVTPTNTHTSTLSPTPTPSETPTATPSHTVTPLMPTSTPTSTPTPSPSPPTPTCNTITLVAPESDGIINTEHMEVRWRCNGVAPEDYGFEIKLWLPGAVPLGGHDAINDQERIQRWGEDYVLTIGVEDAAGYGDSGRNYFVAVSLVRLSPSYEDTGLMSDPVLFIYR